MTSLRSDHTVRLHFHTYNYLYTRSCVTTQAFVDKHAKFHAYTCSYTSAISHPRKIYTHMYKVIHTKVKHKCYLMAGNIYKRWKIIKKAVYYELIKKEVYYELTNKIQFHIWVLKAACRMTGVNAACGFQFKWEFATDYLLDERTNNSFYCSAVAAVICRNELKNCRPNQNTSIYDSIYLETQIITCLRVKRVFLGRSSKLKQSGMKCSSNRG